MRKKVLIVDDERSVREALREKLEKEGIEPIFAVDGEEGLRVCAEKNPDLILLDIIMPKMDGITMLRELRKTKLGKNMPVIILTNLSDAEKVEASIAGGVMDYLVKADWKISDLITRVKSRLGM